MRIFQNIPAYIPYLKFVDKELRTTQRDLTFAERKNAIIKDRFYAAHILKPVLNL